MSNPSRVTRVTQRFAALAMTVISVLFMPSPPPQTARLGIPGQPPPRSMWGLALTLVLLLALVVILIIGMVLGFGIVGVLLVLGIATGVAAGMLMVRRANRQWRRDAAMYSESVVTALERHAPLFLIHWDASGESVYQLNMWARYLEQTGLPCAIIVRNADGFDGATRTVDHTPVVLAESHTEMERLLVPSVTTVFYVNNADRNNQIVRFEHLQHIQLGHGDSDKSTSSTRTFRLFDRIYVAGQVGLDRFAGSAERIPPKTFAVVGRPQVSGIEQSTAGARSAEHPAVLYAPTWRGDFEDSSHSSLPYAADLISALLDRGCRVIFRPHPFTGRYPETAAAAAEIDRRLRAHSSATGIAHVFGHAATQDLSLKDCFNLSDAMIADVSAVLSDYLYSGKPLGAFIPTDSAGEAVEDGWYLFTEHAASWPDQLSRLLTSDPLRERRLQIRDHRLGNAYVHPPEQMFIDQARADVLAATRPSIGT